MGESLIYTSPGVRHGEKAIAALPVFIMLRNSCFFARHFKNVSAGSDSNRKYDVSLQIDSPGSLWSVLRGIKAKNKTRKAQTTGKL
jgi:hypothetical protein